ncbi:hypothetical protein [Phenylobacterium sp.]|jgi:hypothetical protein|uniref:hypothetical protein n=1 Tax=Phenylobacterium sp. TaxID=1871053 RepID=UPI00378333AD
MRPWIGPALAVALAAGPALAADRDPFNGVWTYDAAQSTGGAYKQVLTITVRGDEETYLSDYTLRDGTRNVMGFVARYDGVPVRTTGYRIAPDGTITARPMEVVLRRLDGTRRVLEHKVDGRIVRRLERDSIQGGRAIVSELTDFDAQGQKTNSSRLVFVGRAQ